MKPTLEERIMATGQTLEKVREWQSIIESIAAKTGEPKEDVASIILRPLATGKVMLDDCHSLLEIGVPLSKSFMSYATTGPAGSKALFHELTQLGYNSEKKKKDLTDAWNYGIKLVKGQVADDAHYTVERDGTLKRNPGAWDKGNRDTNPNAYTDIRHHTRQPDSEDPGEPQPVDLAERLTYNTGKAIECLAATSGSSNHETLQTLESALWYVQREIKRLGANNEA